MTVCAEHNTNPHVASPVVLFQCHAFLIHGSLYLGLAGEHALVLQDDALDQRVDLRLQRDHVLVLRPSQQAGAEAHGQVVGLHHVLVTVLGQAVGRDSSKTESNFPNPMKRNLKKGYEIEK